MYWYNIELSNTRSTYGNDANLLFFSFVSLFFVKPAYNVFFFYHFVNGANNGTWLLVCDAHFTDHHSVGFFALCVLSCHLLYSFFLCAFSRSVVVVELSAVVHCFFFSFEEPSLLPFSPLHLSHVHHFRCNLTIGDGDPSYIFRSPAVVSQMIFDARNDMQN